MSLDHPAPVIGRVHNVMVMHLHNHLANNNWPDKLTAFWGWFVQKLHQYNVKVLMGDFNMALFRVIPELRSRGVVIDLAAWFPWKAKEDGEAMADSCGIFFLNAPGEYRLCRNLGHLHEDDGRGILSHVPAEQDLYAHCYDRIPRDNGPGMGLHVYLPKAERDLRVKIEPSLQRSEQSMAVVQAFGAAVAAGRRPCPHLRVKEKRLEASMWLCGGVNIKGSHFPICAFTASPGRRTPTALAKRKEKRPTQWNDRGRAPEITSPHGGGVTSALQPTDSPQWRQWHRPQEEHQSTAQGINHLRRLQEGQSEWQRRHALATVVAAASAAAFDAAEVAVADTLSRAWPGADDSRSGGSSWNWRDSGSGSSSWNWRDTPWQPWWQRHQTQPQSQWPTR